MPKRCSPREGSLWSGPPAPGLRAAVIACPGESGIAARITSELEVRSQAIAWLAVIA